MGENDRNSIWVWLGMACCAVCIVAALKSLDDFRYGFFGKQTTGRIRSIVEDPPQGPRVGYTVWYDFTNPATGKRIRGWSYVDAADRSKYANGKMVVVEYLADVFVRSRIQGTAGRFWPLLLAISLLAMIACIAKSMVAAIRKSRTDEAIDSTDAADELADSEDGEDRGENHGEDHGESRGEDGTKDAYGLG